MAKPDSTYPFATVPGATLEPDDSAKLSGFSANDKPPARWHNWLFNGAHKWHEYLKNLHVEAAFLDKDYVWEGQHGFKNNVGLAKVVGLTGAANEIDYCDAGGTFARRQRQVQLPLTSFVEESAGLIFPASWSYRYAPPADFGWFKSDSGNSSAIIGEFLVPSAARLTQVKAIVMPGGTTLTMECGYISAFGVVVGTPVTYAVDNVSALVSFNPPGATDFVGSLMRAYVRIHCSSGGVANVYEVSALFDDPGPRNF